LADFIISALPWVVMGIIIAIFAAYSNAKSKKEEKKD
jgi:hypothetical protein